MLVDNLIKINEGLPEYNYYLDLCDFLIEELKQEPLWKIQRKIEIINSYMQKSLNLFLEVKTSLEEHQIKGFIIKKMIIKSKLRSFEISKKKLGTMDWL